LLASSHTLKYFKNSKLYNLLPLLLTSFINSLMEICNGKENVFDYIPSRKEAGFNTRVNGLYSAVQDTITLLSW
jgi:hypothetical protein